MLLSFWTLLDTALFVSDSVSLEMDNVSLDDRYALVKYEPLDTTVSYPISVLEHVSLDDRYALVKYEPLDTRR